MTIRWLCPDCDEINLAEDTQVEVECNTCREKFHISEVLFPPPRLIDDGE